MATNADRLLDQLFAEAASIEALASRTEAEATQWVIEQGVARGLEVTVADLEAAMTDRELPEELLAAAAGGNAKSPESRSC